MSVMPKRIAILGSGRGTNAAAICRHSAETSAGYSVALVVATDMHAGIGNVARQYGIPLVVIDHGADFGGRLAALVEAQNIDILVLTGFLKLLPVEGIDAMRGNVLNIHPALLPKYGGKGMYGIHVHRAVIAANARVTGATVHVVTKEYDEGAIIAQQETDVPLHITPEELQLKVQSIEHELYPKAIEVFIRRR